MKTQSTPTLAAVDQPRLVLLEVGDTIERGDPFQQADGSYQEMDKLGFLMGVRPLGKTIKKRGAWFRKQNVRVILRLTEGALRLLS
tara:strand:- start:1138 stop:1395 length:258 start_codon:yes stop_codon:yes gene_type:complete